MGILLGGISGYYGGALDTAIQRLIEFIRSMPTIPLWMALTAALPPYWSTMRIYFGITIILSLIGWTRSRLIDQLSKFLWPPDTFVSYSSFAQCPDTPNVVGL